jgi:hypothetical protein
LTGFYNFNNVFLRNVFRFKFPYRPPIYYFFNDHAVLTLETLLPYTSKITQLLKKSRKIKIAQPPHQILVWGPAIGFLFQKGFDFPIFLKLEKSRKRGLR